MGVCYTRVGYSFLYMRILVPAFVLKPTHRSDLCAFSNVGTIRRYGWHHPNVNQFNNIG